VTTRYTVTITLWEHEGDEQRKVQSTTRQLNTELDQPDFTRVWDAINALSRQVDRIAASLHDE
jgi:hypothetical protein